MKDTQDNTICKHTAFAKATAYKYKLFITSTAGNRDLSGTRPASDREFVLI
jgi:hypothetical protein